MNRLFCLTLTGTTLVAAVSAQKLASYDPAAVPDLELATVACAPLPPIVNVADLVSPPPAATWWGGAIAADNVNEQLYTTNGAPGAGIQLLPFADIGLAIPPATFPTPPGFNQVSGMVVDPRVPAGDTLFVTDGFVVASYHITTATILALDPVPLPGGVFLTGLAHDPFDNRIYCVDNTSNVRFRSLAGGPWSAPIVPVAAVPAQPTGIAFCQTMPGTPFVSFFGGAVVDPATGATMPFPPAPGGSRHHRGLTFLATPTGLGGGGDPVWRPRVEVQKGFDSGNPNTQVEIDSPNGFAFLLIDLAPTFIPTPVASPLPLNGTVFVDPATSASLVFGPGSSVLPLSLVGVPPGIPITFQAAGLVNGQIEMSNATGIATWRR